MSEPTRRAPTPLLLQRRAGAIIEQLRKKRIPTKTAITRGFAIATRALQREGLLVRGTQTLSVKGKREEAKLRRRVGRREWEARFERALRKNRGLAEEPRWASVSAPAPFMRLEVLGVAYPEVGDLLQAVLPTAHGDAFDVLVGLDAMEALYESPGFVVQVLEALQ